MPRSINQKILGHMGFIQMINLPTYINVRGNLSSIIDHFATTDSELYSNNEVFFVTDHLPIYAVRKKDKEHHDKGTFRGRAYSRLDKNKFSADIKNHNWELVFTWNDPDEAWLLFKDSLLKILDKHAPYKQFNIRQDRKPWVTTELLENCNERDNLGWLGEQRNCDILKRRSKQVRNRVVSMKRELRSTWGQFETMEGP